MVEFGKIIAVYYLYTCNTIWLQCPSTNPSWHEGGQELKKHF